jgi:Ni2+-binding GTPase involved in maturation of urease and hydrogenase
MTLYEEACFHREVEMAEQAVSASEKLVQKDERVNVGLLIIEVAGYKTSLLFFLKLWLFLSADVSDVAGTARVESAP